MITVKNLCRYFGDFTAVENISFSVQPGEIFGLLGPNGAGKTTTLRMIAGLLTPSSGEIKINDQTREDLIELKKQIGFLTGSTALYGRLTPRETLDYFGKLNGISKKELKVKIDQLVELFQLGDFQNRWCQKLSTGQKQRVSIARTVLHDPAILIFDEPTSGLDIIAAQIILDYVKEARNQGKAIIFSTHNMSEAEFLCDRLGLVYRGHLIAKGSIDSLKRDSNSTSLREIFLKLLEKSDLRFRQTGMLA